MSKRERKTMHPLRALTLLGGSLGCYTGISLFFMKYPAAGTVVLVLSCAVILAGEVFNHRQRQRDWFTRTFRTYENFRTEVDIEELRQVRRERGDMATVRHLRTLYPKLPAPEVTRLLKEL